MNLADEGFQILRTDWIQAVRRLTGIWREMPEMEAYMGQKMLFVYNPRAGKAQIRSNLLDIIDIFVKAGYEVTAYPTQASGDEIGRAHV